MVPDRLTVRAAETADVQRLLDAVEQQEIAYTQIAYLWGLDHRWQEKTGGTALQATVTTSCYELITLVQYLAQCNQLPRLWVVTAGAQTLPEQADTVAIEQ